MQIKDLIASQENPRLITSEEKQALEDSLKNKGDLSGIILNRTTKHIVAGCQRIDIFKKLSPDTEIVIEEEFSQPNSQGTVARGHFVVNGEKYNYREVLWDEEMERIAMIAANAMGGGWDIDKLKGVFNEIGSFGHYEHLTSTGFDYNLLEDYFVHGADLSKLITAGVLYKNDKDVVCINDGTNEQKIEDVVSKMHVHTAEPEIDENIKTDKLCPKCGYAYS